MVRIDLKRPLIMLHRFVEVPTLRYAIASMLCASASFGSSWTAWSQWPTALVILGSIALRPATTFGFPASTSVGHIGKSPALYKNQTQTQSSNNPQ